MDVFLGSELVVGFPCSFVARAQAAKDEAMLFDVLGDPLVRSRSVELLIPKTFAMAS